MSLISKKKDAFKQEQEIRQKRKLLQEGAIIGPGQVRLRLTYMKGDKEVTESIIVPESLIKAMDDPGESGMPAAQAMNEISRFYKNVMGPGFKEMVVEGSIPESEEAVPAAFVSQKAMYSYEVHTNIVATRKSMQKSLHLNNSEVQNMLKLTAALLCGLKPEQIKELSLEDTMVWVDRTVITKKATAKIRMEIKRLECEGYSYREVREFSVPSGTSVEEAEERIRQRLSNMPEVSQTLDRTFSKIEELRGGVPLTKQERDTVVAYMNITYIADAKNRLIITPSEPKQD